MRKSSKVISSLLIGASLMSFSQQVFAVESKEVIKEKVLAGESRYESAIAVCKKGWESSENAVLVNGSALVDALAATPYAKIKKAPILLTDKHNLTDATRKELLRLGVKNVTIVGGEGVVSKKVEKTLTRDMGIKVERLAGEDRFDTSIKVAKELDVKSVAVVNGLNGRLADAMSVAAPAAQNDMAIILTDGKNGEAAEKFVKDNKINNTYAVGGQAVISNDIKENLKAERLGGKNRAETNAEVLKEFYKDKKLENIYVAKDGSKKESELVDALSAGPLAAKENVPVMLLGDEISDGQKEFLSSKQINTLTKVGYGLSDKAVEEIYDVLKVVRAIDVTTITELDKALKNVKNTDVVRFKPNTEIAKDYAMKTSKEITVELDGKHSGKITIDMPNGDVINNGELKGKVIVENVKDGTFINKGRVEHITVNDKDGASIVNMDKAIMSKVIVGEKANLFVAGKIEEVIVDGKEANLKIAEKSNIENISVTKKAIGSKVENKGKIKKVKVHEDAKKVEVDNSKGNIEKLEGDKSVIASGSENIGTTTPSTGGSTGGGTVVTPEIDKKDEAKKAANKAIGNLAEYAKAEEATKITAENRDAVEKLVKEAKAKVAEYTALEGKAEDLEGYANISKVENLIKEYDKKQEEIRINKEKAIEVENCIKAIEVEKLQLSDKKKVEEAIEKFNNLTDEQRALIPLEVKDIVKEATDKIVKLQEKEDALTAINTAESKEMGKVLEENAEILGLDLTGYNKLANKVAVTEGLVKKNFSNREAIQEAINALVEKQAKVEVEMNALTAINTASSETIAKVLGENAEILGLNLTGYDKLINKVSVTEGLVKKNFPNKEAIQEAINALVEAQNEVETEMNALTAINTAGSKDMAKVLEDNAEILELNLTNYNKLANKVAVTEGLVKKNFSNREAIQEAINALIEKQAKVEVEMNALTAINTASSETMAKVLGENAEVLELDLTGYNKLINKVAVTEGLVKKNFPNREAIQEAINTLVEKQAKVEVEMNALTAINTAESKEMAKVLEDNAKILGLNLTNYNKLINKVAVTEGLVKKNFPNKEAIQEAIDTLVEKQSKVEVEMNALTAINTAESKEMAKVLEENAKILGLDLTNYNKLINKVAVTEGLVKKNFPNKEAIQEAIDALVEKQAKVETEMNALTAINTANSETMAKVLEDNAKILGLDLTNYNKLVNKVAVTEGLIKKNFPNREAIQEVINKLVDAQNKVETEMNALTAINTAGSKDMAKVLEENAKILGLNLTNYNKLANKVAVTEGLVKKNFSNREAIQEAVDTLVDAQNKVEVEMNALTAINTASSETIAKVLEDNAKILGLNLTNYNKLANKVAVTEGLVKKNFSNKEAIQESINALVEKQAKVEVEMNALTAINTASSETMAKVLEENAKILGLNLTGYDKLINKVAVTEGLVKKNFPNKEAIQEAIDALVKENGKQDKNAPANLIFSNNKLTWDKVEGATSYDVNILGNSDYTMHSCGQYNFQDFNSTQLRPGHYDAYVIANFGDGSSKQSEKLGLDYNIERLATPSEITFDSESKMLNWKDVEGAKSYTVFVYDNIQGVLVKSDELKSGVIAPTDKGDKNENNPVVEENRLDCSKLPEGDYSFSIRTNSGKSIFNDSYYGGLDNQFIGDPYKDKKILASPTNVKIDENNNITWDAVENASRYRITIVGEKDSSNVYCNGETTSYKREGCKMPAGEYELKVIAMPEANSSYRNSEWSQAITYTKEQLVVDTPQNVQIKDGILTWDKVEGLGSYFVKIENDVKAQIIKVENDKVSLSLKELNLPKGESKISICSHSNYRIIENSSEYTEPTVYVVE
ncbi:MAG: cell wall-binding repeat-containing protein [Clostridium sp.]